METAVRRSSSREGAGVQGVSPWRGVRFLGGSFLLTMILLTAGVQVARLPNLAVLGVLLLVCAVQLAFLVPPLWNRLFRYL